MATHPSQQNKDNDKPPHIRDKLAQAIKEGRLTIKEALSLAGGRYD